MRTLKMFFVFIVEIASILSCVTYTKDIKNLLNKENDTDSNVVLSVSDQIRGFKLIAIDNCKNLNMEETYSFIGSELYLGKGKHNIEFSIEENDPKLNPISGITTGKTKFTYMNKQFFIEENSDYSIKIYQNKKGEVVVEIIKI